MKILRFNITNEEAPEMLRVLDIPANANFQDLHFAALDAVGFDTSQLSSFFICNQNWEKKVELTLINMGTDEADLVPIMKEIKIKDYEHEIGQKIVFEYDFVLMWRFFMEITKVYNSDEPVSAFPKVVESIGDAPKQYETFEKYPAEMSDEDSGLLHDLEMKNMDFFHHGDEAEGDDDLWETDDVDGLEDFKGEEGHDDEDFF